MLLTSETLPFNNPPNLRCDNQAVLAMLESPTWRSRHISIRGPGIRVFAELILLAYLRSLHIAQESMCRSFHRHPDQYTHMGHRSNATLCVRVSEQRARIDHAFNHQWRVASHINWSTLTAVERQVTEVHTALTDYLYLCWNLT
eukprot:2094394-Amphidinium_carterae.1